MKETPHPPLLHWGLISKYRSQLFGFAILWIMLFHSRKFPSISHNALLSSYLPYDGWIGMGSVGVDVFLFLSGVGLYYAMLKKPSLTVFYCKRMKRILIPYLIIGGSYWVFRDILIKHSVGLLFKDLSLSTFFTDGRSTFWYIALILPLYLLAPLFLRLFESKFRTPILCALFALCLAMELFLALKFPPFFARTEVALTRIFDFILGCYFGKIVSEKRPISRKWLLYLLLVLSCRGLVFYVAETCLGRDLSEILIRLWYNAAGLAICILIPILLELLRLNTLNRFLNFLGIISLELYLSHLALRNEVKILFPTFPDWSTGKAITVYLGILMIACAFSYLFHLVQTKLEQS